MNQKQKKQVSRAKANSIVYMFQDTLEYIFQHQGRFSFKKLENAVTKIINEEDKYWIK